MSEMMSLNISQDIIKSAIQEEVKAGIIRALGNPATIVKDAIAQMTNLYVNDNGKIVNKGSWGSTPYFDWLATETVKNTIKEELEKYINEHIEEFRNVIRVELGKKEFKQNLAAQFIQTITNSATYTYRMPVKVEFERVDKE